MDIGGILVVLTALIFSLVTYIRLSKKNGIDSKRLLIYKIMIIFISVFLLLKIIIFIVA